MSKPIPENVSQGMNHGSYTMNSDWQQQFALGATGFGRAGVTGCVGLVRGGSDLTITGGAGLAFTSMTARDSAEAGSVAAT